jgi:hypothetical protein
MRRQRIALLASLALAVPLLSGCSIAKSLEKDLAVIAQVDGEVVFSGTTNIFNNTLLPKMDQSKVASGSVFLGWALPGWTFDKDSRDDLYGEGGLVRYNDVLPFAVDHRVVFSSVVVAKSELPQSYLTVGWYDKETTSGLNSAIMANFTLSLSSYLASKGASTSELENVVIRGYQGNVATIGADINKDADVDILVGVGGNITTTGLVVTKEMVGGIMMGPASAPKSRYIARLSDKEVAVSVYAWLQTTEGRATFIA